MARGKVCYVGQPVAIAVARDRYQARDALEGILVDYEPLTPVLDPMAAMRDDAIPIHPEVGTNLGLRVSHEGGDMAAAFAQADRVIQQRYHVQRLPPCHWKPVGWRPHYQADEDFLTVWNSTQAPHRVRRYLAPLLKRPESRMRVIAADVGGGFGEKGCMFPEDVTVPYLSSDLGPAGEVGSRPARKHAHLPRPRPYRRCRGGREA